MLGKELLWVCIAVEYVSEEKEHAGNVEGTGITYQGEGEERELPEVRRQKRGRQGCSRNGAGLHTWVVVLDGPVDTGPMC